MGFPAVQAPGLKLLMVREHPPKQWPLHIPSLPFCYLQRVTVCKGECGEDAHRVEGGVGGCCAPDLLHSEESVCKVD